MKQNQVKEKIQGWLNGAIALHGQTYDRTTQQAVLSDKRNKEFLTALCSLPADEKAAAAKIISAWESAQTRMVDGKATSMQWGNPTDESLMSQLCAIRLENINNFIVAMPTFMAWYFEEVSLKPDEEPYIVNETKNEVGISYVSEDGTPTQSRLVRPQSKYPIGLRFLSSDIVRYKTLDVYRGDVSELTKATFDLTRDLRIKLDLEHFRLLNAELAAGGCFGAFSYEQDRSDPETRIYVPHSAIHTEHFPVTNDYDLTQAANSDQNPMDETTDSFDILVLMAILDYAARWGDLFDGGPLVATGEILVPASDIIAIAKKFTPTANVAAQQIQEQINANGYMSVSYLGKTWKFVPSLLIPKGTCYPRFNMVPGLSFFKTGLDREIVTTNLRENWEEREVRKVYGAAIVNQRRIRALRIKYASDSSN